MRRDLIAALDQVVDAPDCLGAGLADASGLLVQAAGAQAGLSDATVSAVLAEPPCRGLEPLLGDQAGERLLFGMRHTYLVLPLLGGRYFVYALAPRDARTTPVRAALRLAAGEIERRIEEDGLLEPSRERLDEPRKFAGSALRR